MKIGLSVNNLEEPFDMTSALEVPINISAIQANLPSAGPGLRTEVFFHGCSRGCPGCINEWTNSSPFRETTVREVTIEVMRLTNFNLTIGGGEPFEQEEALIALLRTLDFMRTLFVQRWNILLYTGNEFVDVMDHPALRFVDYLITGPFVQEQAYVKVEDSFIGSSNQMAFSVLYKEDWPRPRFLRRVVDEYGRMVTTNNPDFRDAT